MRCGSREVDEKQPLASPRLSVCTKAIISFATSVRLYKSNHQLRHVCSSVQNEELGFVNLTDFRKKKNWYWALLLIFVDTFRHFPSDLRTLMTAFVTKVSIVFMTEVQVCLCRFMVATVTHTR
jgi:hypothetical protein